MGAFAGFLMLTGIFYAGFKLLCGGIYVTGVFLKAMIWLFIKLPFAMMLCSLGFGLCCTLIFIPIGIGCFKLAGSIVSN